MNTEGKPIGFNCTCERFYFGPNCQYKENPCEKLKVNCSSQGICMAATNVPRCVCFKGYNGDNCEIVDQQMKLVKTVSKVSAVSAGVIIGGIVAGFVAMDVSKLVMMLLAKLVWSLIKRRDHKQF